MFPYNQTKLGRWSQNVLLNRPISTAGPVTASGRARRQNFCTAQTTAATSLDHFVGTGEKYRRHLEAERLCRSDIDDQLEARRLLDRQVGRLGTPEYLVHIRGEPVVDVRKAWA